MVCTPGPSGPWRSTMRRPIKRRRATLMTTDLMFSHSWSLSGFSSWAKMGIKLLQLRIVDCGVRIFEPGFSSELENEFDNPQSAIQNLKSEYTPAGAFGQSQLRNEVLHLQA